LFWRHGCSAARNSPACKGKSLRCLRKCRFAYIDTSPALSARRHLTTALRPSRLHLGCQSHQTMVRSRASRSRPLFSAPNSKLFAGNYGCNRRSRLGAWHAPGRRWEPECEAVRLRVAQVVKV
jgi:hypothetical protein